MNKLTRMTDYVRVQDSNFFAYIVTALLRNTFVLFTHLGNSLLILHTQPPQEILSLHFPANCSFLHITKIICTI